MKNIMLCLSIIVAVAHLSVIYLVLLELVGWRRMIKKAIRLLLVILLMGTAWWLSMEWYYSGGNILGMDPVWRVLYYPWLK
jgi:hypothetical protein